MEDFESMVQVYSEKRIDSDILNSTWNHAVVLFDSLFDIAQKNKNDIKIISGGFNPEFYDKFVEKAKSLLDTNHIDVIVLTDSEEGLFDGNKFLSLLKQEDNASIHRIKGNRFSKTPHFILVGDDAYRFEIDHKRTKAVANFNNIKFGEILSGLFDAIFNSDQVVAIKQREALLV